MTISDDNQEAAKVAPGSAPRVPRFGAAASGAVSLLLVGGLLLVPLFGLLVAPLGLVPVLHYQADGSPGFRAWGWVVALLAAVSSVGLGAFPLALLAAYLLIVVLPSASVEAWARMAWSESRWVAITAAVMSVVVLAGVAAVTLPEGPVAGVTAAMNDAMGDARQMYGALGFADSEIDLAFDASLQVVPWLLPSAVIAYLVAILFWIRPRVPLLGYAVTVRPFEQYRGDDWIAAAFAVTGLGALFLDGTARWAALNLLMAVLLLYFVQGLAMIRAHLARWVGRGWFVRWGVALMSIYPPMPILVTVLGVADSFFPLRPAASDDGGNA